MLIDLATLTEGIAKREKSAAGNGIGRASEYACTLTQDPQTLKETGQILVYRNEDCLALFGCKSSDQSTFGTSVQSTGLVKTPNALMDFEAVMSSKKKDRDQDILLPQGASLDMCMPLLLQHTPKMIVGKIVKNIAQNTENVINQYAIADCELGRDAVALVEFGALRISHGFRALEAEYIDPDKGWSGGLLISKYEVMETSLVSIPSNTDAMVLAWSREKLHSPVFKKLAEELRAKMPTQVTGGWSGDVHVHVDLGSTIAAIKEGHVTANEARDAEAKKLADQKAADAEPPVKKDAGTVAADTTSTAGSQLIMASLSGLIANMTAMPGIPDEAKSRLGICSSILTDAETCISARAEDIMSCAKSKDILGIFNATTSLIRGLCYGLSSIADEAKRMCSIDGMSDDAKTCAMDLAGQAGMIESSMMDVIRAALGITRDSDCGQSTEASLLGCSVDIAAEKNATALIAELIKGVEISTASNALLTCLLS